MTLQVQQTMSFTQSPTEHVGMPYWALSTPCYPATEGQLSHLAQEMCPWLRDNLCTLELPCCSGKNPGHPRVAEPLKVPCLGSVAVMSAQTM